MNFATKKPRWADEVISLRGPFYHDQPLSITNEDEEKVAMRIGNVYESPLKVPMTVASWP